MAMEDLVGKIQTVLGVIEPDDLGVTLTHEHLLVDLSVIHTGQERASAKDFYDKPVALDTVGRIRHYAYPNFDNSRLLDVDTAIDETMLYKQYGGDSLVDATSVGISRDPIGLARISRATGVNIIMGASHYVAPAHPADMDDRSEDFITEQIVNDVTQGADGTNFKSGIIGEVGCSWPLTDNERKVLRASARAQKLTGAPILIHPGRDEVAPLEIIEALSEAGADLSHTIIGHLDRTVFLRETLTKMDDIAWMSSDGYGERIVVAHDICSKDRLEKYGGHGYSYILGFIVPRMRTRGYTEESINNILVENPKNALTFFDPNK